MRQFVYSSDILEYLNKNIGGLWWKNYSTGIYDPVAQRYRPITSMKGVSDILGVVDGVFVAIEVKSPSNKKRPEHQQEFLDKVIAVGGVAFFADSVDTVKEELLAFGLEIEVDE
jgi:hypothetical protein